jgi:hypothetical protein
MATLGQPVVYRSTQAQRDEGWPARCTGWVSGTNPDIPTIATISVIRPNAWPNLVDLNDIEIGSEEGQFSTAGAA